MHTEKPFSISFKQLPAILTRQAEYVFTSRNDMFCFSFHSMQVKLLVLPLAAVFCAFFFKNNIFLFTVFIHSLGKNEALKVNVLTRLFSSAELGQRAGDYDEQFSAIALKRILMPVIGFTCLWWILHTQWLQLSAYNVDVK